MRLLRQFAYPSTHMYVGVLGLVPEFVLHRWRLLRLLQCRSHGLLVGELQLQLLLAAKLLHLAQEGLLVVGEVIAHQLQ